MLPILPTPRSVTETGRILTFPATHYTELPPMSAYTLSAFASRTHDVQFTYNKAPSLREEIDPHMPEEAYILTASPEGVVITAATVVGVLNAISTLIQIMEKGEDSQHFTVPECRIEDAPSCSWRGVMIDLARNFHDIPMLYEYVDMCRFFKIRYLHLHFTDDQSYTLPSLCFPKLSTPDRSYTEHDIRALVTHAQKRGVCIIPEIDVPGHCTSFAEAYGDIFGRDGIICQNEVSMTCMEALFRELCALFDTSPYIHIGGDEAAITKWTTCEKCLAAYRAQGVDVDGILSKPNGQEELAQIMYATFVARMAKAVLSCGKTPVVWEGFGAQVNHLIPPETVVMSWENYYQVTPSLQKAGFRLLNCSWSPMYIVAPDVHWSLEEVYRWNVYTWHPVHGGSPYIKTGLTIPPTEQVEGGQLLAWGDRIPTACPSVEEGVRVEQNLVEERVPALAENTWNREKVLDFPTFQAQYQRVMQTYRRFCGRK